MAPIFFSSFFVGSVLANVTAPIPNSDGLNSVFDNYTKQGYGVLLPDANKSITNTTNTDFIPISGVLPYNNSTYTIIPITNQVDYNTVNNSGFYVLASSRNPENSYLAFDYLTQDFYIKTPTSVNTNLVTPVKVPDQILQDIINNTSLCDEGCSTVGDGEVLFNEGTNTGDNKSGSTLKMNGGIESTQISGTVNKAASVISNIDFNYINVLPTLVRVVTNYIYRINEPNTPVDWHTIVYEPPAYIPPVMITAEETDTDWDIYEGGDEPTVVDNTPNIMFIDYNIAHNSDYVWVPNTPVPPPVPNCVPSESVLASNIKLNLSNPQSGKGNVTISADASNYKFSGWGGLCEGTSSCTVTNLTANSAKEVTAGFNIPTIKSCGQ